MPTNTAITSSHLSTRTNRSINSLQNNWQGDELVPYPYQNLNEEQQQLLAATGFCAWQPTVRMSAALTQKNIKNIVMADTIKIMLTSLIGLTVGCAQCHDHRYDPISQKDYYGMRALLEPALKPGKLANAITTVGLALHPR
ncbi:MAG: DUF1549 domain-containing protein [Planctomycetaceae bacterium]